MRLRLDVEGGGGLGAEVAFAFGLAGAHLAAAAGVFVAAALVFGLGKDRWDEDLLAGAIDGDEGEVGGGDVAEYLRLPFVQDVFDHDTDAHLHGGAEGAVHAGFEDEDVTDTDGGDEVEVVHARRDADGAGVAEGGHGGGEVDVLHQTAAEEVAEGVRVGGKDDLGALGLRVGDGAEGVGHLVQCTV